MEYDMIRVRVLLIVLTIFREFYEYLIYLNEYLIYLFEWWTKYFYDCEVYPNGFDLDSQLAHFSYDMKHMINMRWLANPTWGHSYSLHNVPNS